MINIKKFVSISIVSIPILAYSQALEMSEVPAVGVSNNQNNSSIGSTEKQTTTPNQLVGEVIDLATISNPNSEVIEEVLFEQEDPTTTYQYWGQTSNKKRIESFLSNGQNVNYELFEGNSLLLLSSMRKNEELFNLALSYKANIAKKNDDGKNIMHYIFSNFNTTFFDNVKEKIGYKRIDELTAVKDKYGATPVHYYLLSNTLADDKIISGYMLKQINSLDNNGLTPGHYAINSPNCMNLNVWLKSGGDIKVKNNEGESLEESMFNKCSVHVIIKNFNYLTDSGKERINSTCAKIGLREDANVEDILNSRVNQCFS